MTDISRRSFLASGGVAAGVAAFAAVPAAKADEAAGAAVASCRDYRTFETDVVVVGGGVAGMFAAQSALANGANVIILDKGPFGHSGTSGINWGHCMNDGVSRGAANSVMSSDGLIDQVLLHTENAAAAEFSPMVAGTKSGSVYERDAEDGLVHGVVGQVFMPRLFAHYVKNLGAKVMDRVMVTDVLTAEDGSVAGVVGFDTVAGDAVLVRCRAAVLAAGNSCCVYGWCGVGPKAPAGQECTGDAVGILFNHGIKQRNFECAFYYGYNCFPESLAYSQNVGVQSSDHPYNLVNKDGVYFMEEAAQKDPSLRDNMTSMTYWKIVANELYRGRGLDQETYYLDITNVETPEWRTFSRRFPDDIRRAFGVELENPCQLKIAPYSTPIRPEFDGTTLMTPITGLFFAGECEDNVGPSGFCAVTGHIAGGNAAGVAKGAERASVDEEQLAAALDVIYGAFENKVEGGLRPIEVQHRIQQIVHEKAFVLTTEEGLNEALAELRRIKEEDIPAMTLVDTSRHMNVEWKQALEVPFMWQNAMAIATARLNRPETRGTHFRADYLDIDPSLLKNIYVVQDGDAFGVDVQDIVTDGMTVEEVQESLVDFSHLTAE
jgi:succinate dehydrogenase / fumarate reductase flavoprotein subunit